MAGTTEIWSGEHVFLLLMKASPEKKQKWIDDFNKSIGFDVQTIREWKTSEGLQCPRCGPEQHSDIVCNGKTKPGSDRQRYLCRTCGASFNDHTGTVLHKSKKAESWPAFLKCMLDGKSIRRSASEIGISPTTAQAWRKKILTHLSEKTTASLSGIVEYTELTVQSSIKGQKTACSSVPRQKETLVFCKSRSGSVYVGHGKQWHQNSRQYQKGILWHTHLMNPTVLPKNFLSPVSSAERKLLHTAHVDVVAQRFAEHYANMRGVASKHLHQYAAWHQFQDQNGHVTPKEKIRRLLRAGL